MSESRTCGDLIEQLDEFNKLFYHMNKVEKMSKGIVEKMSKNKLNLSKYSEQTGKQIYNKYSEFRDLATVMEHPEFLTFYYKYMENPYYLKQILMLMKLYSLISKYLYEQDPNENNHNAYHKLAILHQILTHPVYSHIILKKLKMIK
jgi:hypothetical protein